MEHNKKEPDDDVHSMDVTPVYDPGTLIMLTSLLMAVMGIVLLLMGRASTPAIAGYRHWAAGSLLAMFSGLLISLRGEALDWLTYTIPNTAAMLAYTLYWIGSARYFGQQPRLKGWVVLFVVAWIGQAYFTHVEDSLRGRYLSLTGYVFAASLMHAIVFAMAIFQRSSDHRQYLLGVRSPVSGSASPPWYLVRAGYMRCSSRRTARACWIPPGCRRCISVPSPSDW